MDEQLKNKNYQKLRQRGDILSGKKMKNELWQNGRESERGFWSSWFATKGLEWTQDYVDRLDENLPFQQHLVKYLPELAEVSILDVGSGPLTILGKVLPGRKLKITAVDPLADVYNDLLSQYNISPIVRTEHCDAERLSEKFAADHFDFIHVQNALDHSYEPLEGIKQMLRVLKKCQFIFMAHNTNEAEKEKYVGFHQWNFCREGDRFIIWNREERIDVNDMLSYDARINISGDDAWNVVEIKKLV